MTATIVTTKQYVELQEDSYRIVGKRVSLDSIVYAFLAGQSPESILQSFPTLTLEDVLKAVCLVSIRTDPPKSPLTRGTLN